MSEKVSFIGLGVMGYPMAGYLAKAGHAVTVFNRTAARAERWAAEFGGTTAPSPAAAADGADFVFCCVGNDDDLRAVTVGEGWRLRAHGARQPCSSITRRPRPRSPANCTPRRQTTEFFLRRRPGIRRPGRRRERPVDRDDRRRRGCSGPRRAADRLLRAHAGATGRIRLGPVGQDGQPDLHRRPGAGPGRSAAISPIAPAWMRRP